MYRVQLEGKGVKKWKCSLTDTRTSGRFTAELRDVKFLFDSMPQVKAHRITNLSLTVKRKKEREPQGNSQQDYIKEVTIRSWLLVLKIG